MSYYTKGALVALALDLKLRLDTAGRTSLDDVIRELWRRYGALRRRRSRGRLRAARRRGQRPRSWRLLRERRARHRGSAAEAAARGVRHRARDARGVGRGRPRRSSRAPATASCCRSVSPCASASTGSSSRACSTAAPAERAGLNPGDVLVAIDRLRVTGRNLARRLARFESGERVTATVFRGDELLEVGIVLKPAPLDTCYLTVRDASRCRRPLERRRAWLGE